MIKDTRFLAFFLKNVFTEEMYNPNDLYYFLSSFNISKDAVFFQLKGFKRVLLLMRFK